MNRWEAFDEHVIRQEGYLKAGPFADLDYAIQVRGTSMAAEALAAQMDSMLLLGDFEKACLYAERAITYASAAIKHGHTTIGGNPKESPRESKHAMTNVLYSCRWLLTGTEVRSLMEQMLALSRELVAGDAKRKGRKTQTQNWGVLADDAARLGQFDLASTYHIATNGPTAWADGCTPQMSDRLFGALIALFSSSDVNPAARSRVIDSYTDFFATLRSGRAPLTGDTHWRIAVSLAYFGLKFLEELRQGAPFTYENVVRSIRYEPTG